MAVVEVDAGIALPGPAVGIEVSLARMWAFGEKHAVVFQQRTLAVMELGDRAVVVDQRAVVGALGIGPPPLGIEQLVERDGARLIGCLHCLHLPFGSNAAVEVGLRKGEIGVDVTHRLHQGMGGFQFLVLQAGPFAGQLQLEVTHRGQLPAESQRHEELRPNLPFLELPAQERRIGIGAVERVGSVGVVGLVVLIDQILAHAEEPVAAVEIEPG